MSGPANDGVALIAYDGSEDAQAAVRFAARVLRIPSALVVTAWTGLTDLALRPYLYVPGGPLAEAREDIDRAEAAAGSEVAEHGAALAREAGFGEASSEALHRDGRRPWRVVVDAATAHDSAVVVAGARGRGAVKSALIGSTSRGIAAHCSHPVLIARWDDERPAPEGPVMLCYDGSDASRRAIHTAASLLSTRESPVVAHVGYSWLAHANPPLPIVRGEVRAMARELDDEERAATRERARAGAELAVEAGFAKPEIDARLTGRTMAAELARMADAVDASLVVMGTHGMTGIAAHLGSVSLGLVNRLDRPFLVCP